MVSVVNGPRLTVSDRLLSVEGTVQGKLLRRQSAMAPSMTSLPSLQPSTQKVKRGSVLGRLVKRFSVMRKPDKATTVSGTEWQHFASADNSRLPTPISPLPPDGDHRASSRMSKSPDPVRRVPAPSIDANPEPQGSIRAPSRRSSGSSVHEFMTSGRLTIANPDEPWGSGGNTPLEEDHGHPPTIQEEATPRPMSRENLPLPEIPRTDSPAPLEESVRLSRPYSTQLVDNGPVFRDSLPPISSPPLPELPLPTPATVLQSLPEPSPAESSPAPSTVVPPSPSPTPAQIQKPPHEAVQPAPPMIPMPSVEDIALARASMFVNPPTPYTTPLVIPAAVVEAPEPSPSKRIDRSPTKSKDTKDGTVRSKASIGSQSRQTETFKLIRSPSGNIKQAGEVIMGMGEQWEVVGSPGEPSSSTKKSKSKDRERSKSSEPEPARRRESKRRDTITEEPETRHKRHPSNSGREKAPSPDYSRSTQTPIIPERVTSTKTARRSSTLKKPRNDESKVAKSSSAPSPVAPSPAPAPHGHERQGSAQTSTRPNSELHSSADYSSMKAKDAWEMERLWKARSMAYGPDGMPVVSTPATIGSDSRPSTFISTELQRVSSIPSVTAVAEMQRASSSPPAPAAQMHGSSHTYVVVQTPYQGAQGQAASYTQFASASTPILYPPGSPQSHPQGSPTHQYHKQSSSSSPPPPLRNSLSHNPLPEPPRLSSYQPAPLPPSLAGSWTGTSP